MNKRFIFEEIPLTAYEARLQRWEQAENLRSRIRALYEELRALIAAPLPTSHTVQIAVAPGDPRYESAPFEVNCSLYQGETEWAHAGDPR